MRSSYASATPSLCRTAKNIRNPSATRACLAQADKATLLGDLPAYVQAHAHPLSFPKDGASWAILSPIEQSIKAKIETYGTPLKEWPGLEINYGVKTGLNEAFIIDGKTKDALIAQDPKSAEIIRPILRGKDIKRYGYTFADKWLIATFPALHLDIDNYPAVRDYLLSFDKRVLAQTGEKDIDGIKGKNSRKKTGNKWFETQDQIAYWSLFSQPKIVWSRLTRIGQDLSSNFPRFALISDSMYTLDSLCIMSGRNLPLLLSVLNSEWGAYYLFNSVPILDNGGLQLRQQYVEKLPIPNALDKIIVSGGNVEENIYNCFNFTLEERKEIRNVVQQRFADICSKGFYK